MKHHVVLLRRAAGDLHHISDWIAQRSPQGARSWLEAFDQLLDRLADDAEAFSAALEDPDCSIPLKQALFRTRHGRTYRVVFTIVGNEVRILRVRGPGQSPLQEDELV